MNHALPPRVIGWYGDDFTGSTDVLEALAPHMPSVLFMGVPSEGFLERFSHYSAFGVAGSSRSESPEWMEANLAPVFEWLGSLNTAVCHYKVCSTFDSSPRVGSIGRAMEIGRRVFGSQFVPLVVGAPSLRRYTVFGNLFAAVDGIVYRIDRHPTMKNHPVTPMREADLRFHLAEQTSLHVGLLDALQLEGPSACERYRELGFSSEAVLIDVMNEAALPRAGRLLWSGDRQRFITGSSGVEYSLIAFWREEGLIAPQEKPAMLAPADRIVVLSGSCSPVTQAQIEYAGRNSFELVRLDVRALASGAAAPAAEAAIRIALNALSQGRSVVLYTASAPHDRVEDFPSPAGEREFRHALSSHAGQILNRVVDESGVRRIVVAGGDTSSHAGRRLGIDALTFRAHIAPGAPLCTAWSEGPARQGLEVVLKGGQCGRPQFFETVLNGSDNGRN